MPVKKCNKYDVLFVIAYFNIPENSIQWINIIQWIILHSLVLNSL